MCRYVFVAITSESIANPIAVTTSNHQYHIEQQHALSYE